MRENLLSLPSYKFTLPPTHIYFSSLQTPKLRRSRVQKKAMEVGGLDSKGRQFKNAEEMWREQTGDPSKKCDWYKHGVGYWEGVEASVNGVLGGYAQVDEPDIEGSEAFLNTLLSERFPNSDHFAALGISTLSLCVSVFLCVCVSNLKTFSSLMDYMATCFDGWKNYFMRWFYRTSLITCVGPKYCMFHEMPFSDGWG